MSQTNQGVLSNFKIVKKKKKKKFNYYSGFAYRSIQHWFATSKKKRQTLKAWTPLMLQSWRLKLQFHRASRWFLKAVESTDSFTHSSSPVPDDQDVVLTHAEDGYCGEDPRGDELTANQSSHSTANVHVALPEFDSRPLRITFTL